MHYAGVGAQMDAIMEIAERHGLIVIEDAAQAYLATFRGKPLGTFGAAGAISFHETKNLISGEGGALVVNDPAWAERAEIIWEKGTNRAAFARGEVARYTWVDVGSSFLPSELTAAFLLAQLEGGDDLTERRLAAWRRYDAALVPLEAAGVVTRPRVPQECSHNGHIYYVLARDAAARDTALVRLREENVMAVMHYVPLHSAPAGRRFGRTAGALPITDDLSSRLIRLPLHASITPRSRRESSRRWRRFWRRQRHRPSAARRTISGAPSEPASGMRCRAPRRACGPCPRGHPRFATAGDRRSGAGAARRPEPSRGPSAPSAIPSARGFHLRAPRTPGAAHPCRLAARHARRRPFGRSALRAAGQNVVRLALYVRGAE